MECKHVGNRVIQKKGEASTCKSLLQCKWLHSYLSSLITSTKWASVFSRMFLNLSGRRADWSKLTPAHLPFSCKIDPGRQEVRASFKSGGLRPGEKQGLGLPGTGQFPSGSCFPSVLLPYPPPAQHF